MKNVLPFPVTSDHDVRVEDIRGDGYYLAKLWTLLSNNVNKWMRVTASVGLTSMSALNTYQFLSLYNDWRAALAAAVSFELMYIASAWKVKLPKKWSWVASDVAIIVVGVICATIYNVFNHIAREVDGSFQAFSWKVAIAVIQSVLLTLPACLLMISVHAANDTQEREATRTRLERIEEAITVIRSALKV